MSNTGRPEVHCVTHCDPDGYASAIAVKQKHPNVIIHVTNHGRDFPFGEIPEGSMLYLTDFSYKLPMMQRLDKRYKLVWIDHHERPILKAEEAGFMPEGFRDTSRAACLISWQLCNPDKEIPWSYKLLDDYDRWQFKIPETIPFNYGIGTLSLFPSDQNMDVWDDIVGSDPDFMKSIIDKGAVIQNYVELRNKAIAKDICFDGELVLDGRTYKLCIANIRGINSMFFDSVPNLEEYDAVVSFAYVPSLDKYRYSIYSNKPETVMVDVIAAHYGGSGHPGAAGWLSYKMPWVPGTSPSDDHPLEDHLVDAAALATSSNVIGRFACNSDRISIRSLIRREMFLKYKAIISNTPFTWASLWHNIETSDADIGITYVLTNTGEYRIIISNLATVDMEALAKEVNGTIMPNGTIWFYQNLGEWPEVFD